MIIESDTSELFNIFGFDRGRRTGELFGEPNHCQGLFVEACRLPLDRHPVDQFVICDLNTEIVEVRRRSVVAVIDLGGDRGKQFSL